MGRKRQIECEETFEQEDGGVEHFTDNISLETHIYNQTKIQYEFQQNSIANNIADTRPFKE